ncbi:MAG: hypothetical protein IKR68_06035 [Lachnospiraceae bacterium]|nr:hypothetical protein [Lachnospiraceae bacterium]
MNSKLLHFMKQDIKHRSYIMVLSALIFFFNYPVVAIGVLGRATDPTLSAYRARSLYTQAAMSAGRSSILIILGFFALLSGFRFLHKSNRGDFIHSIPVDRKTIFTAVNLDNLIMLFVPYSVMYLISVVLISVKVMDVTPLVSFFPSLVSAFLRFLPCYALTLLAIMLTGNLFTAVAMNVFLEYYVLGIFMMLQLLMDGYFETAFDTDLFEDRFYFRLSPSVYALVSRERSLREVIIGFAIGAVIGIAALILSYVLYKKRALEQAGRSFVFRTVEVPVKFLLVIPFGVLGAVLGEAIGGVGWTVFCLVCAVVISHCILEIIFHSDFRKLFARKLHMVICLGAAAFVFLFFSKDLSGFDHFVPVRSLVKSAGVYCSDLDDNLHNLHGHFELDQSYDGRYNVNKSEGFSEREFITSMEIKDVDMVIDLAKTCVDELPDKVEETYKDGKKYVNISICWHMVGGRDILRRYRVPIRSVKQDLEKVYDDQDYKLAAYPVLAMNAKDVGEVNFQDATGIYHIKGVGDGMGGQLLETYKADFSAMTAERRKHEDPIYCLKFKSWDEVSMLDAVRGGDDNYLAGYTDFGYYPVYPSFRNTIAAIKACGEDADRATNPYNYQNLVVYYGGNESLMITDPQGIREALSTAVPKLKYKDDFSAKVTGFEVVAYAMLDDEIHDRTKADPELQSSGYMREITMTYRKEDIPALVRRYFGITPDYFSMIEGYDGWDDK